MKHKQLDNAKKEIILKLRSAGKKDKKNYLVAVSDAMDVSSRNFASVNVYKLNKLFEKNKDKVFVVPGIVLAYGSINSPVKVYAYKYSLNAIDKIVNAKGIAKDLNDLVSDKIDGKNIIIVK